jgi:transcriptional regulator with XRE-family HTH domain
MKIGERIKVVRTAQGKTLRVVEKDTGISNSYLSQLETGAISKPSYKVVQKLYDYFGIKYDEGMDELTTLISTMTDTEREQLTLMAKFILNSRPISNNQK